MTCPHCGEGIAAGDAFCEACGGDLDPLAAVEAGDPTDPSAPNAPNGPNGASAPTAPTTLDQPRTHLLQPGVPQPGAANGVDTSVPCAACGAVVADDGFCSVCGHKARTRREHWTETHDPAGSPGHPIGYSIGAVCDKGIAHARNEDAMATDLTPAGVAVVVVCDGVTTAPDSDRASLAASAAACDALVAAAPALTSAATESFAARAERLGAGARRIVPGRQRRGGRDRTHPSATRPSRRRAPSSPLSSTATLVAIAWCGDSRAYWIADATPSPESGAGEQLTLDHSLGTEMIRAGMTREQAEADPTCHTITRWLGADSVDPSPEYRTMRIEHPGWLLVCSDGMWNYASTPEALRVLVDQAIADGAVTPTSIAESLTAFANEQGGHDNITVAMVRCTLPAPVVTTVPDPVPAPPSP